MKTSNYLAKLLQEATIKSIQVLKDYDLNSLHVSIPNQRLCPHCSSNNWIIKDSDALQSVRHIPATNVLPLSPFTSTGSYVRTVILLSMRLLTGSTSN